MNSAYIQVALYPVEKLSVSNKSSKFFLSRLQEFIGVGNIILGKTWNRLITPTAEILFSSKGCVEVYGDANELTKLILGVLTLARDNGHPLQWIFLDSEKPTAKTKEIISKMREELIARQEGHDIMIGGEG